MKAEVREHTLELRAQAARRRLDDLYHRAGASPPDQALVNEALEELSIALADLQVSVEGMRVYNDELTASRQELDVQRRHYAELFDFALDGYLVTDIQGTIQEANRAAANLLHTRQDILVGKPIIVFIPEAEHQAFKKLLDELKEEETVRTWAGEMQPRVGASFPAALTVSTISDGRSPRDRPTGARWLMRDVSERRQADEQIQADLRRITALHDINVAITSTLNLRESLKLLLDKIDGSFAYPTATTIRLVNRDTGMLEKLCCQNIDLAEWQAAESPLSNGRAQNVIRDKAALKVANIQTDSRSQDPDFYIRNGLVSYLAIPLIIKDEVIAILCVYTREEHEFSSEEIAFLSALATQVAIAIYNSQLYEQSKTQAAELQKAHNDLELRVQERTAELADANEALRAEIAVRQRVEDRLRDVTNKLEEKLIVSDRLISFGELAASIAHEFNNPLQIILGFTQDILDDGTASESHQKALDIVVKETGRCKEIIKSLLDLARPSAADLVRLAIEYTIDDSLKVCLPYLEKSKIKVETIIQPGLPQIYADPQQLRQVIINLCFNAAEAMLKGGRLTIRAGATTPSVQVRTDNEDRSVRRELIITVSDTGAGIDSELKANIFRPFYSTKKGKGMGLGLYICERIMETHKGRISVESAPGRGATFYLHFPLAEV